MQESRSRYSTVSIALHWLIALLILSNVLIGGWMEDAPDADKLSYFQMHKSVGVTVLILSLVRLSWRLTHPWPPLPDHMPAWDRAMARATHVIFYVLMIGVPLLGYAAASAGGAPEVPLYGIMPAPNLPLPQSHELAEGLGDTHKILVKTTYVVLALHVLGALKHHFLDKDEVLHRILPIVRRRG
jgi:cytochrome b561